MEPAPDHGGCIVVFPSIPTFAGYPSSVSSAPEQSEEGEKEEAHLHL